MVLYVIVIYFNEKNESFRYYKFYQLDICILFSFSCWMKKKLDGLNGKMTVLNV